MTLIIGVRCSDGVVLASDRRVLRGVEYSEEDKIRVAFPQFIVAGSGVLAVLDKFMIEMGTFLQDHRDGVAWRVFLTELEDIAHRLRTRYEPRLGNQYQIDIICAFKDTPTSAHLYHISREGFGEEINTYFISGSGYHYALPFVKTNYNRETTIAQMNSLSAFIIELMDKHQIDVTVGGRPQIFNAPFDREMRGLTQEEIDALVTSVSPTRDKLFHGLGLGVHTTTT